MDNYVEIKVNTDQQFEATYRISCGATSSEAIYVFAKALLTAGYMPESIIRSMASVEETLKIENNDE